MKKWKYLACLVALGGATTVRVALAQTNDQDKQFLTTASQANIDEIELSELAERKAAEPDVRKFAETMVKQHTEIGESMKPFADKWGITPATTMDADHQKEYDKLSKLSGKAFDKEYIDALDKDHHGAEDLFTNEIESTNDQDFKNTVMNDKSAVVAHTNMADQLKSKLE